MEGDAGETGSHAGPRGQTASASRLGRVPRWDATRIVRSIQTGERQNQTDIPLTVPAKQTQAVRTGTEETEPSLSSDAVRTDTESPEESRGKL